MNQYQAGKLASQHRADLLELAARHGDARQARAAGRAGEVLVARAQRHRIRRRAGWALVGLGLRLAYAAGED